MNKDWLFILNTTQWLMSPNSGDSPLVFAVDSSGFVSYYYGVGSSYHVHPTFYLTSTTSIIDGDGTLSNPYILK